MTSELIVWDAKYRHGEAEDDRLHDLGLFRDLDEAKQFCLEHAVEEGEMAPLYLDDLEWGLVETNYLPPHHYGGWEDLTFLIYPRRVQ